MGGEVLGIYLRGTTYWFEKRVPAALKKALKQTLYRVSLDTSNKSLATARGLKADFEIKAEWSALKEALAGGPKGEYEKANKRAVMLGMTYTDVSNLKGNPKAIADRPLAIGPNASEEDVVAALGLAPKPSLMLSQMCEVNETLVQFDIRQKSPDQMRKWRVQRARAANNLFAVVGDIPLDQFTREHALTFKEWWRNRIEGGGLQANTANKDLTCLQGMWRSINDRKMILTAGTSVPAGLWKSLLGRSRSKQGMTLCGPVDECRQCEQGVDKSTMMRDQTPAQSSSSNLRVAICPRSLTSACL
jgi:hypothetical protein